MKRTGKTCTNSIAAFVVAAALVLTSLWSIYAAVPGSTALNSAVKGAADYLKTNVTVEPNDLLPYNNLDWSVFAVLRSGQGGYTTYQANINAAVQTNYAMLTLGDLARIALAAGASVGSATIGGHDLLAEIAAADSTKEIMTGNIIYALLALDAFQYAADAQKQTLLDALLAAQRADGSYNYLLAIDPDNPYSVDGDVDSTAMALNALAPYRGQTAVDTAVDKALTFLHTKQLTSAGFGDWGESADSISQVIISLCTLGIDPLGTDWLQGGNNMLSALLAMRNTDGGTMGWNGASDVMSTYQTLCALAAYLRYTQSKSPLFVFDAQEEVPNTLPEESVSEPETTTERETAGTTQPESRNTETTKKETTTKKTDESRKNTVGAEQEDAGIDIPNTGSGISFAGISAALSVCLLAAALVLKKKPNDYA